MLTHGGSVSDVLAVGSCKRYISVVDAGNPSGVHLDSSLRLVRSRPAAIFRDAYPPVIAGEVHGLP